MSNRNKKSAKRYKQKKDNEIRRTINSILDSEYSNIYGICSYFATFIIMIIDAFSINVRDEIVNFGKTIVVLIALAISWIWKKNVKKNIQQGIEVNITKKAINFGYMGFVLCAFTVFINSYNSYYIKFSMIILTILLTSAGIYYPFKIAKITKD